MYFYASNHLGYASNHHFHIRYAQADIKQQTAGLVLHLARYLLSMELEPSPIAIQHDLRIDQGDISLYVSEICNDKVSDRRDQADAYPLHQRLICRNISVPTGGETPQDGPRNLGSTQATNDSRRHHWKYGGLNS
jgi:hypothetical protein